MNNYKILLICLLISTSIFGQNPRFNSDDKKAQKYFEQGMEWYARRNFDGAKELYLKALHRDPDFVNAHVYISKLYKQIYFDKEKWIYHVEEAARLAPHSRELMPIYFDLGQFLFSEEDYEKALKYINLVIKLKPNRRDIIMEANKLQLEAEFGKEAVKNPLNFEITKLDKNINYSIGNYLPSATADNQTLLFTSLNIAGRNRDENLLISTKKDGKWQRAESISDKINTPTNNEGGSSISGDGRTLVFTQCGKQKNGFGRCDLYISYKEGNKWSEPLNLGAGVNTPAWESQPSLSTDGRTLYFVSDRKGGFGNEDIYVSTKINDTTWTQAENLGNKVNTFERELAPFIHANGRTLYFSSTGYYEKNMGGFDFFKYDLILEDEVENLGYPVNTSKDETTLFITADASMGYFSKDEFADPKTRLTFIYEFVVPEEIKPEEKANYAKGEVYDLETKEKLKALVEVFELKTNKLIQKVHSDPVNGSFLITLNENVEYGVYVSKKGYLHESVNFNYSDQTILKPEELIIGLKKLKKGQSIVLNNVFFETGSYQLDNKSKSELNKLIELLNDNENVKVEVSGHTDDVGTDNDNKVLSDNRAKSVKKYLQENGISASRIVAIGYGETKPTVPNDSDENRAKNRRIEFKVL